MLKKYAFKLVDKLTAFPRVLAPMTNWERFYGTDLMNRRERIRNLIYSQLKSPKKMRWYGGRFLKIYPNNDVSRALFTSGTYEPNSLYIMKNFLVEDSIFFDIGANIGVFTIAASNWIGKKGRIIAFEPSSREYALLQENVSLNRLKNVQLEKLAISNSNGATTLNLAIEEHRGQNTLCKEFAYEGVASGICETVTTQTIDRYILEKGISRLDLIKLDIEGAEYNAFLGSKNTLATLRPILLFEIVKSALQKNGIDVKEIESYLIGHGYKIFSIDEQTARLVPSHLAEMKDGNAVALPSEKLPMYAKYCISTKNP